LILLIQPARERIVVPLLISENALKEKLRRLISLACGPGDGLLIQSAPASSASGDIAERFFPASAPLFSHLCRQKNLPRSEPFLSIR
jgi:hypothetical protein